MRSLRKQAKSANRVAFMRHRSTRRAAFNAACLAGESPALGDCLFDQVVMSGLGGGDESQGSPDVKGPWDSSVLGRGVPVGTGAKQPRGMQHKANIAAPSDPPQGAD